MAVFNLAAGHGAGDSGAVYGARLEKNDNLKISLAVESELKRRGHTVRQYRSDDSKNCDWKSCRAWLEKNKADFSVVFHRNAFNGTATGIEVWSYNPYANIAAEMSAAMASASALYNRGRKPNGAAWLSPNVPCCEPEIGFIDNASDNAKFDKSFDAIVKAVCDTLENHYGKGSAPEGVIAIGTTTNYLNIRTSPVNGAVLISMPTGSKCNIFSIENGWAKLEYNGVNGYSSTDYMTIEYIAKTEEENEPPESASNGATSEDNSKGENIPEKTETAELPPQNEPTKEIASVGEKKDENIPILVKILNLVLSILKKIWSGRNG